MAHKRDINKIVVATDGPVKARILAAGVKLGDLARAAGVSQPTISVYLAGRLARPATQLAIFQAFRRLSGQPVTMVEFWGDLLAQ